jgi:HEPN domain-containing protein
LELALKYYLWDKNGAYPTIHDLETLAFKECTAINFTQDEISAIKSLNGQYLKDGEFRYPSRYRPAVARGFTSISQDTLEMVISKIIQNTNHPELVDRIIAR